MMWRVGMLSAFKKQINSPWIAGTRALGEDRSVRIRIALWGGGGKKGVKNFMESAYAYGYEVEPGGTLLRIDGF